MATNELKLSKKESRLYMSFMYVTYASLLIGGLMGLLQTLVRSVNIHYLSTSIIIRF